MLYTKKQINHQKNSSKLTLIFISSSEETSFLLNLSESSLHFWTWWVKVSSWNTKQEKVIGIFNFQDQKINRESGKFQEDYKLQNRDLKILAMSEN